VDDEKDGLLQETFSRLFCLPEGHGDRDHHIPQESAVLFSPPPLPEGEGEHIGRPVDPTKLSVQAPNGGIADEGHVEIGLRYAQFSEDIGEESP